MSLYKNLGRVDGTGKLRRMGLLPARQEFLSADSALSLNQDRTAASATPAAVNAASGNVPQVTTPITSQVLTQETDSPAPMDNAAAVSTKPSYTPLIVGGLALAAAFLLSRKKGKASGIGAFKQKDVILLGGLGVLAYLAFSSSGNAATSTVSQIPQGVADNGVDNNYKPYTAAQQAAMNQQLANYGGATNLYQAGRNLNQTTAKTVTTPAPGVNTNP